MDYEITLGQTTAVLRRVPFFLPDEADGFTPVTGKIDSDFTCRVSKNGADALHTGTFVEHSAANQQGMYYYEATAGEVDTEGWLLLVISCAGCVTQRVTVRVGLSNVNLDSQLSTDILTSEGNIRAGSDTLDSLGDQLDTVQADLDDPTQYKADVSALAIEGNVQGHAAAALTAYDPPTRTEATADKNAIIAEVDANEVKIDAVQADLNNPAQYKANVSALALEATAQLIKAETDDIGDIPGAVLEESVVTHKAVANSLAYVLQVLKRRTLGKVTRTDESITIYDDDGTTVLATIPVEDEQYGPPSA